MAAIVSLGSLNVDCVQYRRGEEIQQLEDRYDWFPHAGETVRISDVPDDLANQSYQTFLGGKGANQAVAAARCAGQATLLGCVGTDEREYDVFTTLEDHGVVVDEIAVRDTETGKAYIYVDEAGEAWIGILGGANDATDDRYIDHHYDRIRAADTLILQNEIPIQTMDTLLERLDTESDRPLVIFNPAPPTDASTLFTHDAIDVVVVNEAEHRVLEDALEAVSGTIVTTNGADDILISGATTHRLSPPTVDPVDTTGSGDVLCGYLAARLAAGDTIERATELAAAAASLSTETEGAQEGIPSLETVTDFLESQAELSLTSS